jgi:hypothetical protein
MKINLPKAELDEAIAAAKKGETLELCITGTVEDVSGEDVVLSVQSVEAMEDMGEDDVDDGPEGEDGEESAGGVKAKKGEGITVLIMAAGGKAKPEKV